MSFDKSGYSYYLYNFRFQFPAQNRSSLKELDQKSKRKHQVIWLSILNIFSGLILNVFLDLTGHSWEKIIKYLISNPLIAIILFVVFEGFCICFSRYAHNLNPSLATNQFEEVNSIDQIEKIEFLQETVPILKAIIKNRIKEQGYLSKQDYFELEIDQAYEDIIENPHSNNVLKVNKSM